jgi:hypothetical protein
MARSLEFAVTEVVALAPPLLGYLSCILADGILAIPNQGRTPKILQREHSVTAGLFCATVKMCRFVLLADHHRDPLAYFYIVA